MSVKKKAVPAKKPAKTKVEAKAPPVEQKKKRSKEETLRLKQVIDNPLVKVELGETPIPLQGERISATAIEGLSDYLIEGTHLRLLCMTDPTATPTLQQRVEMAKRLNEVGPFLPRYISSVKLLPGKGISEGDIAAANSAGTKEDVKKVKEDFGLNDPKHAPKPAPQEPVTSRTGPVKKMVKETAAAIEGGIPLKKICSEVDIDPKDARRALRAKKIDKPGGRWEWTKEDAPKIKDILKKAKAELDALKAAEKGG